MLDPDLDNVEQSLRGAVRGRDSEQPAGLTLSIFKNLGSFPELPAVVLPPPKTAVINLHSF